MATDELVGKSIKIVIPEDLHEQVDNLQERCKRGEKIRNVQSVRRTRNGRKHSRLAEPLLAYGQKGGWGMDSLHYPETLDDLKKTEETLRQRTKALEQMNQDLEQFTYKSRHTISVSLSCSSRLPKSPSAAIWSEAAHDGAGISNTLLATTNRMDALIKNLLVYSRLGTQAEALEPTDFNLVLTRALENLKSTIEKTRATIRHDPLPTVMANPSEMSQLLQNLIGNAVKFVRKRLPVVTLTAVRREREWVFSVQDNGIGIPPSGLLRIFLPFERCHDGREFPGTGIGLANCKKIVERHSGRIWVDSIPGEGSIFSFSLPDRGSGGITSDR